MDYNPGNILLDKLTLVNYRGDEFDILSSFSSIEIFEDILDSTLSARVVILDTTDLYQNFPIIGREKVLISFRTTREHAPVNLELMTYDIPIVQNVMKNVSGFVLELMTEDGINARTTHSMVPMNGNVGDAIKSVMTDVIGSSRSIEADQIINKITYIPPRQKPFEVINTLCNRAVSNISNDVCDILFYDTVDGYKLKSLTGLMREPAKFRYRIAELNELGNEAASKEDFFVIGSYTTHQAGSILGNALGGSLGGSLGVFDIVNRQYTEKTFNIIDDQDKFEFINSGITVDADAKIVKNSISGNFRYVLSGTKDHSLFLRTAKLDQVFSGNRLVADLAGNSDLRVGQTLEISVPSSTADDAPRMKDDRLVSGKYLITSLRHVIGPNDTANYRTVVELMKDSNKISLDDTKDLYERLS